MSGWKRRTGNWSGGSFLTGCQSRKSKSDFLDGQSFGWDKKRSTDEWKLFFFGRYPPRSSFGFLTPFPHAGWLRAKNGCVWRALTDSTLSLSLFLPFLSLFPSHFFLIFDLCDEVFHLTFCLTTFFRRAPLAARHAESVCFSLMFSHDFSPIIRHILSQYFIDWKFNSIKKRDKPFSYFFLFDFDVKVCPCRVCLFFVEISSSVWRNWLVCRPNDVCFEWLMNFTTAGRARLFFGAGYSVKHGP